MWIVYSFLSAMFGGSRSVYDKHLLHSDVPPEMLGFLSFICVSALTLPVAYFLGEFGGLGNEAFLQAMFANVALNVIATILYFKMLRMHDASLIVGIQSIEPLFVIVTTFLLLGERISMIGFAGIVVVIFGSLLLQKSRSKEELTDLLLHSPWVGVLVYMCVTSSATAFSKMALLNGGVFLYLGARYLILALVFLFFIHIFRRKQAQAYAFRWSHLGAGLLLTGGVIFEMLALQNAKVAYVETLRRSTVFFALICETIFLRKAWNMRRFWACVILFSGAAIIILFG